MFPANLWSPWRVPFLPVLPVCSCASESVNCTYFLVSLKMECREVFNSCSLRGVSRRRCRATPYAALFIRKVMEQFNKLLYPGEKQPRAWSWDTVMRGISLLGGETAPSPHLGW